ncbi:MAG: hypothetical protein HC831_16930 [Chloroflexia bacterium]|nr:hypothetical protein [Chloroflexia bacterium]
MGLKLAKYYQYIIKEKGMQGRIELGVMTKISSIIAPLQPDSPENIKLFKDAIKKITGKEAPDF